MATYAIGDIHGCWDTLQALLERIDYSRRDDCLWLVGDLVNGGPSSLRVLRWARQLGDRAVTVLGNHDLHMLAVAHGAHDLKPDDTFEDVLRAEDSDALLDWLRRRPLLHRRGDWVLVHAGLLPQWSVDDAVDAAHDVETRLRGPDLEGFFDEMYGNEPRNWSDELEGIDRARLIINAMTRMRCVDDDGALDFDYKETLAGVPSHLRPWFDHPERQSRDAQIVFGHWSAVGYLHRDRVYALDSGARWGGKLTALRLDDRRVFQVESHRPSHFD
jgi:bis(5'-nucleosyl)-tetraphosphatase (symmetrical)